jgi:sulfonate transport system substrate-binding protein
MEREREGERETQVKSKRSVWIIGILIILALIIGGYFMFFNEEFEKIPAGDVDKLKLGAETSLLNAAVWIAEDKGYFEKEGLDIEIKEFTSGKASFNDMLNGGGDISTVAPTPIMFNSFKRQDFSIIATFVYSDNDFKVIARKDSGISQAKDLKGKKVGIVDGSTSQFFLSAFLTLRGLKDSDVETIDFESADLPRALNDGKVDVIVIWEPHVYNAGELLGSNAIRLPSSEVYRETFNFMVMNN